MNDEIVITGIGVISPVGIGGDVFWNSIIEGKSGVGKITTFDTSRYRVDIGAEVKGFDPEKYIRRGRINKMGRASQFSVAATLMAIKDSGYELNDLQKLNVGVSLGTTMGEIQVEEEISKIWVENGIDKVPMSLFSQYPCNNIPLNVSSEFNFNGPNLMIPTACAAANYAIGMAYDLLKSGKADIMIAGGVDPLSRVAFSGFHRLMSLAPNMCQPFDANRKGIVLGEGAGILVLERLERAKRRKANIYAKVMGYGLGCDAHHMTAPHPEGKGGIAAIKAALKLSGVSPTDINYISAHGTGTKENDRIETKIIKNVFESNAKKIPVSSIKSMIGHTMGAASALEAILCTYVVKNGIIPPTINYQEPDPECDLDYVPNYAREWNVNVAMSNAYAFGGNDAVLIIGKYN